MARDHLRIVNGEKKSIQMELDRVKVYGIGMYYYSVLYICIRLPLICLAVNKASLKLPT